MVAKGELLREHLRRIVLARKMKTGWIPLREGEALFECLLSMNPLEEICSRSRPINCKGDMSMMTNHTKKGNEVQEVGMNPQTTHAFYLTIVAGSAAPLEPPHKENMVSTTCPALRFMMFKTVSCKAFFSPGSFSLWVGLVRPVGMIRLLYRDHSFGPGPAKKHRRHFVRAQDGVELFSHWPCAL